MSTGPGYRTKKRVKNAKLGDNVTGSKGYKQDKQNRKKSYKTGGFLFGKSDKNVTKSENIRASANTSLKSTKEGKNDESIKKAIKKLDAGTGEYKRNKTKATLGNPVITVKKKRKN